MSRNAAPAGETNQARFKRVAGLRLANALEAIRKLEALGNATSYEHTEAQLDKMFSLLETAVIHARNVLEGKTNKAKRHVEL